MKPDLPIPTYTSDQFTWLNGRGCAEASDFGSLAARRTCWIGSRLFSDACDIGFYVVSTRTGKKLLFTYVHDEDGYDGEIQVYASETGVKITIIND